MSSKVKTNGLPMIAALIRPFEAPAGAPAAPGAFIAIAIIAALSLSQKVKELTLPAQVISV